MKNGIKQPNNKRRLKREPNQTINKKELLTPHMSPFEWGRVLKLMR